MKRAALLLLALLLATTAAGQSIAPASAVHGDGVFALPGIPTTGRVSGNVYFDSATTGSTGGGAAVDVSTFTADPNMLGRNGAHFVVAFCATHAANTNSTTLKLTVFGTALSATTSAASAEVACGYLTVTRVTSTTATVDGYTTGSGSFVQNRQTITGLDFTTGLVIKYSVQAATTTNDLIGNFMSVDLFP